MLNTVSELTSEIRQLENTITYCQNEILRRQIAIQELFRIYTKEKEPVKEETCNILVPENSTVAALVICAINSLNGDTITVKDLYPKMLEMFPTERPRIRKHCLYNTLSALKRDKVLEKIKNGYKKVT